ncbi:MAG: hypothetical protein US71_C0001G0125 [Parcubacteria group bacterium GW2011_GWD2_38_12]|nr:MAG: hypothetical protein US06_C0002G0037 [Parcubacteria group bacterium GW2011_GWC2_36_17]KKQ43219.1 MAG: hypothetical protein US61_C0014G0002 [Parcubacteria group bacterium GW2011_GWE2_37_8]KKQ52922.1 MAG: hypothetical protein US71_C0001G0125 [Parcubacteria group bacterium GW2011_GWD2_38_12]KKQ59127.1 MAG: hypothetical protein US79_C0001G0126 [Parcubacteria group bacterium GW2011_GWC1_38_17]KKQ59740.1 MAG: hypothetical protein US78_C0001G0100 [Parcubacteria group bacterium GW2011_GWD1_38_1
MARIKIYYTKESQPVIERILLDLYEICPIENCGFQEGCNGKRKTRDNEFECYLEELLMLFKK